MASPALADPPIIGMGGLVWHVRTDAGNPGPNAFDAREFWEDSNGAMHLKLTLRDGAWKSAELYSNVAMGFGVYQFEVIGAVGQLDGNVVLGLSSAPPPGTGTGDSSEINVEFTTWGNSQAQAGNWTVWPDSSGPPPATQTFDVAPAQTSTHRFTWRSDYVKFQSLSGFSDDDTGEFANWTYAPTNAKQRIPQSPQPMHMNLWLVGGTPPSNGQSVEIVIKEFVFLEDPLFVGGFED
jgi:hypothetical protein